MEFKGTKGEWFSCCLDAKPHFIFSHHGEVTICAIKQTQDSEIDLPIEEVRANALLISKAPKMLHYLSGLLEDLKRGVSIQKEDIPILEQLIKEATEI